jgi:hypothetical protein
VRNLHHASAAGDASIDVSASMMKNGAQIVNRARSLGLTGLGVMPPV